VELDKNTSPQAWKARWADWSQPRMDKHGRVRPKQKSIVLGYKTKDDLPTKSAAEKKWDSIRESVMHPPVPVDTPGMDIRGICTRALCTRTQPVALVAASNAREIRLPDVED
jgi:hypothetical protein